METPVWLTRAYIENALKTYYKDKTLKLQQLNISPALNKGENFGGILTSIKVQFQLNNGQNSLKQSYILKTSFESDEFAREKMKPYDIFKREMSIYEQVLPKLQQLLNDIDDNDQLFAKAIYVDYEREALIFEDLREQGFVMADRTQGLNMSHVLLILRKLAKMHATSAVLNERAQHCLESYDRGFFNRYTDTYSTYFVSTLMACAKYISGTADLAKYAKKLYALEHYYMEIGKRCFAPTPGHVNVLAHGDVWTNNVMFKYDAETGEPIDLLIIDFQYSFWGSPTLDLHHLFNTSLKEELRLHEQDKLVQFYHGVFSDVLKKLQYAANPVPNLNVFCSHFESKRFFAFHSSCVIQPVMLNEDTENADFTALMAEDERALTFKQNLYKNSKVQRNLRNLLPIFDHKGLLDVDQS